MPCTSAKPTATDPSINVNEDVQVFRDFLHYERRLAPLTTRAYTDDVQRCLDDLSTADGPIALAAIGPSHLRHYLLGRSEAGVSNVTLARNLTSLRTFFAFATEHLGLAEDPTLLLQAPKKPHRLPPAVDAGQLGDWLTSEAFAADFSGQRDLAVVMTLYLLGLRRAELLSLKLADVADGASKVRITGKRSRMRLVPVAPALRRQWDHYLRLRSERFGESPPGGSGGVEALFVTDKGRPLYPKAVYNLVSKHLSGVGWVEGKSPHLLASRLRLPPHGRRRGPAQRSGLTRSREPHLNAGVLTRFRKTAHRSLR